MISDYFPPEQRARALSFYSSGIYIGIIFGFLFGGVIADAFGWRMAFLVVGIPGVLFAIVLRLTVREPLRGRGDAATSAAEKPGFSETLAFLTGLRSFWYLALGCAFTAFTSYGNGNFFPSFLIRNHGLSLTEVGLVLALVSGVCGAIGTFLGGYLGDRYGIEDKRWYLWVPLIGVMASLPPYLYVLLTENTTLAMLALIVASLTNTLYLGPCIALSHSLVPPSMRALTSAILLFVLNMIGLGMGPFFTGFMSDFLQPAFGDQNLRYAMVITTMMKLIAAAMFFMAAKYLVEDLTRKEYRLSPAS